MCDLVEIRSELSIPGPGNPRVSLQFFGLDQNGPYTQQNVTLSDSEIDGEGRNFPGDATLSWHRLTGLSNPRFFSRRALGRDKGELALRGESLIFMAT